MSHWSNGKSAGAGVAYLQVKGFLFMTVVVNFFSNLAVLTFT